MARNIPLPPDLQGRWGHLPYLQYQGSNEWSAACPQCGDSGHIGNDDPDRFRLFGPEPGKNGRGWCRSCGYFSWADEGQEKRGTPSPEAIAAAAAERQRLAADNRQRMHEKITAIREAEYWKAWHDIMDEEQRKVWRKRGVIDEMIDDYSLGYRTDYTYYHDGHEWCTPALTIPHYDIGWELSNIQFRLQDVAPGAGKYRQTPGLPAAMFLTQPDHNLKGATLVVEGAIKAIILYQLLGAKPIGFPMHIVGIPSKMPSDAMLSRLADAEPVYLLLDPDAYIPTATHHGRQAPAVNRVAAKLGRERVRIAKTPVKPDDLLTQYGGDIKDITGFLKEAARA